MGRKRIKIHLYFMRNKEIISIKIMSALQLKNSHRYFHETEKQSKLVSDNVQRTRTVTPPTIFVKLYPFEIFLMKSCLLYYFNTVKNTFVKLGTASDDVQRITTVTPATFFLQNNALLRLKVSKSCPFYNFKTVINMFMKPGTNIKLYRTICREQEP